MQSKQWLNRLVTGLGLLLLVAMIACISSPRVEAADVTLRMATADGSKETPIGETLDLWAKMIEENSDGAIKVNVFYQGELGGQTEVFDQFVMGDIDLMLTWPFPTYDKRISVLYCPYMVLNWEDAKAALRPGGWLNGIINEVFTDIGLKFFGPWPEGFNGIATRNEYATTIAGAEEKGIKVRTPPAFPFADTLQAMGYMTADIAWTELYTAIQTGVADGDAANIIFWDYEYFRDVIDYYTHYKMMFMNGILAANLSSWEGLDTAHQKIIMEAAEKVMLKQFEDGRARDLEYRRKAIDHGIEFIELTPEEHAEKVKVVREKVWPMMAEKLGTEIMEKIRQNASTP